MPSDKELIELFKQAALDVGNYELDGLSTRTEISDLGIDSVELLEIFGEIESELDIRLEDEDLAELETLGDLVRLIRTA